MSTETTKVIIIGRHTSELPADIEVIEQRSITWSINRQECKQQLVALWKEVQPRSINILLQNAPAILACAISDLANDAGSQFSSKPLGGTKLGMIISVPGERKAGVTRTFAFDEKQDAYDAAEAARFVNPNAKIEVSEHGYSFTVTVDPPTPFVFSHIEWL